MFPCRQERLVIHNRWQYVYMNTMICHSLIYSSPQRERLSSGPRYPTQNSAALDCHDMDIDPFESSDLTMLTFVVAEHAKTSLAVVARPVPPQNTVHNSDLAQHRSETKQDSAEFATACSRDSILENTPLRQSCRCTSECSKIAKSKGMLCLWRWQMHPSSYQCSMLLHHRSFRGVTQCCTIGRREMPYRVRPFER